METVAIDLYSKGVFRQDIFAFPKRIHFQPELAKSERSTSSLLVLCE